MYNILCLGSTIFTLFDKVTQFGLICRNLCSDVEMNLLLAHCLLNEELLLQDVELLLCAGC